jgi:tripartite-type tricarboxylate transporter receptor subunit TctC
MLKAVGFAAALAAAASLASPASHARGWPNKPVKVVVPFAAGGAADRLGRLVADELTRVFKQQFYIENRVGGGGAVAATQVARAEPDGYTLLIGSYGPHVHGPAMNPNIGYDPMADFTHIAMIGGESYVLVAHSALGVKSFADLVRLAKSRTEAINCGSPGTGSLGQLVVELLRRRAGLTSLNHVPYRGGGPLLPDLLGNHVSLAAAVVSPILPHVPTGTLVPLAVTSRERDPALKNVPSFTELGYPDIEGAVWFWVAGPKNLPAPIVEKISVEVRRTLKTPEVRQRFARESLLAMDVSVAEFNKFLADELKRWSAFIEEAGLKQK